MFKRSVVLFLAFIIGLSMVVSLFIAPKVKDSKLTAADKIAIIYVDGMIAGGRGQVGLFTESGGTDALIRQLHSARDDAAVKAVVLRINSPGGTVPASQEVGEELKKLRAAGKPVVTSMGDMAASGGYWLAACTDKIYANPATITGSLGVYMPYSNWEELYQKIGVRQEKIKSGPHKDILSPDRPLTAEERAIIQVMVDDMYNQFVEVIAEGRGLEPDRVRQLADGRIYTGRQAKELGLVDELGNMYDAIDGTAAMVGIAGKPEIVEYGKMNALEMLLGAQSTINSGQLLLTYFTEMLSTADRAATPQGY
ncbi:signal peptide peptidase SppA [Sporomusa sphaeroides]|uniref:Signal peptide peptidase SppA n=2 Tax=Sporomusa TaxID=2375 RepID=A0ABM9W444_9FIRM|nr:signal peptide peptidase SppA [Sporomusa sphaeroides]OLS56743.1 putative signal peptide peptidase SppA [Sporomusa sphaeroides DSM 2875]CVK18690.1 Putative signal peptide peptidase SppA [Sporomusa sphaeroides DSM 2875]SCM81995.1 putative signal peptide peptidase SppA [uncultured Sporomusa sp.]